MTDGKVRSRRLTAEERAKVFKALSDPSRVAIVDILAKKGPLNGTEIAEKLGMSLALVCHHWGVLADAGIVQKDRVGQCQYCSLDLSVITQATSDWDGEAGLRAARATGSPGDVSVRPSKSGGSAAKVRRPRS
ncbi:MAG: ArsR family transcriptional regulator [Polyangiaceae bacterium]|nr:ArsR family transcriptional regulator [Polyangiaceae bacterium]